MPDEAFEVAVDECVEELISCAEASAHLLEEYASVESATKHAGNKQTPKQEIEEFREVQPDYELEGPAAPPEPPTGLSSLPDELSIGPRAELDELSAQNPSSEPAVVGDPPKSAFHSQKQGSYGDDPLGQQLQLLDDALASDVVTFDDPVVQSAAEGAQAILQEHERLQALSSKYGKLRSEQQTRLSGLRRHKKGKAREPLHDEESANENEPEAPYLDKMQLIRREKILREKKQLAKRERERAELQEQVQEEERLHKQRNEDRLRQLREDKQHKFELQRERREQELTRAGGKERKVHGKGKRAGKKEKPLFLRMQEQYKDQEKEVAARRQEALKAHREAFQPIDRNEILEHERRYKEALVEVQRKKQLLEEQKQREHEEELHRRMHAAGGADQGVCALSHHSEDEGGPLDEYPMLSGVSPTAVQRNWTAREDLEVRQSWVGRYSGYGEHNARYSMQDGISESANESDAAPPGDSASPAPRKQPAQPPPEMGKPAGKRKKRFKGKAMAKVIEQDWMRKEEQLSRKTELKQRRAKQKNYANMVKELYLPPVDQDLQEELEERVEKNKPVKLPALKKEEQRRKYRVRDLFADRRVMLQREADGGEQLARMEASARVSAIPAEERWAEKSAHARDIEVQGAVDGRVPLLPDIELGRHTSHGPISGKQRDLLEPQSEAPASDAKSDPGPPKPKRVAMAEDKKPHGLKTQESRMVRRQKAALAAEGRARQAQEGSIPEGTKSRKTRKSPRSKPPQDNGDILLPSLLAAGTSVEAADLMHKAHESELRAKKVAASVSMSSDVMGEIELDQKASELYVDAIKNKLAAFTAPFDGHD